MPSILFAAFRSRKIRRKASILAVDKEVDTSIGGLIVRRPLEESLSGFVLYN
jgi:hypothetical protein